MMILAIFLINVTFAKVRENLRYCRSPKIFTLDPKPAGQWPQLVRLEFISHGSTDSLGCSGTIISDGLILTARVLNISFPGVGCGIFEISRVPSKDSSAETFFVLRPKRYLDRKANTTAA